MKTDKTVSMDDRIIRALRRTFDVIAPDAQQAADAVGERITEEEIQDMAGDGYVELHGGDKGAADAWYKLPKKKQNELMKKTFPHRRR